MRAAMGLARALNRTLCEVLRMPHYEVQLWFEYLAPEAPEPDLSAFDGMCD